MCDIGSSVSSVNRKYWTLPWKVFFFFFTRSETCVFHLQLRILQHRSVGLSAGTCELITDSVCDNPGKKNVPILYIIMDGWLIMPCSIYRQIENMELYMQHYTKNYPSALPNRCNIISPSGLAFRQLKQLVQSALYDVVFVCHTPVVATTVHSRWRLVHPVIVDNFTTKHCRAGFSLPEIGCWITPEVSAVSGDAA